MKEGAVVGVVVVVVGIVVGIVAAHLTRMTIGPARSGPIIRVFFFWIIRGLMIEEGKRH